MIIYYTENFRGGRAESRRLLEKAIAEYTGDAGQAGKLVSGLKTGEHGKPYIEGFEHFSVSHTGGIWAVLIDTRECGLDIQLAKKCDFTAIARRIYAAEDAELIALTADEDRGKACGEFFRLWTRREALAKAIGGTVYDTELPSVMADDISVSGVTYRISDIGFPLTEAGKGREMHAAVCVENAGEPRNEQPVFRTIR